MNRIYYLTVIIIFIVSAYETFKNHIGPSNSTVMKGYSKGSESIPILLDRIQWANHYPARMQIAARYGFYAILISFFVSIVYESKLNAQNFLQSVLIVWVLLIGTNSFFGHHSDKFSSHYIDDNLTHIRRKLGLKSDVLKLCVNYKNFKGRDDCSTFVYQKF